MFLPITQFENSVKPSMPTNFNFICYAFVWSVLSCTIYSISHKNNVGKKPHYFVYIDTRLQLWNLCKGCLVLNVACCFQIRWREVVTRQIKISFIVCNVRLNIIIFYIVQADLLVQSTILQHLVIGLAKININSMLLTRWH